MISLTPRPWEDSLHARLTGAPINEDALLELFDRVAPDVWAYSRQRTRGQRAARQVAIQAFLTAAQHPAIFADRRVPIHVRMIMLVHLDTERAPVRRSTALRTKVMRLPRRQRSETPRTDLTLV
ncbi:hypothetical protein M6D93_15090 [Jatrophihabitans telluris]|uniref:Nuclear transport factor 2 family protein n=1 Tax=Jatrophihabitans telluris TaxID=2038343 RepID=A0ABY4QXQ5_9ACTN|nr:hypothetical protein [Jatrophihabitans telluris]UQX87616.1 hypothetical protein M6D93_15090 [Jatrophihabitans telluris]